MIVGMFISTTGAGMIWPFLTLYVSKRLELPLTTVGSLLTLNAAAGIAASFMAGPVIDRFGRKWMMVLGLGLNAVNYLFLAQASSFVAFAILLVLGGIYNPVYRIAADAMLADLVPAEKRTDAYATSRLTNNLGIAIGPAVGGIIAAASYNLAFYIAAAGMAIYSLLLLFFAVETLPLRTAETSSTIEKPEKWGGYQAVLGDRKFMRFVVLVAMGILPGVMMWVLMPVYVNSIYNVPVNQYGLIPTTNAAMVVTLQLFVTRITKRYPSLPVMACGAFFYGLGAGLVALAAGFWGFWTCMVIMTIGELILVPTSSSYAANQAPVDKRARYMSIYGLTWSVSSGIGPIFGGILSDMIAPWATWVGGGLVGMSSALGFLRQGRRTTAKETSEGLPGAQSQ
jgi:MFS family permease